MKILSDHCAHCGGKEIKVKSRVSWFFIVMFFLSAGLFIFALPFIARKCKCLKCGHIWKVRK
ncbi:MAG: hypothetical protein V1898_02945 [Patescibacteria group bacterium]